MGRKSKAEWEELLAAYECSSQSQRQFCQENGIRLSGFLKQLRAWRQLRKPQLEKQKSESTNFVMVAPTSRPTITRAETNNTAVAVTVGPFTLTIERHSDPMALRVALQAVAETCGRI